MILVGAWLIWRGAAQAAAAAGRAAAGMSLRDRLSGRDRGRRADRRRRLHDRAACTIRATATTPRGRRWASGGDFITAPLVSQMFGELIGLWAGRDLARDWARRPRFVLAEAGPGRRDADGGRAARRAAATGFLRGRRVWLVEASRAAARARRPSAWRDAGPRWVARARRAAGRRAADAGRQRVARLPARPPVPAHRRRLGRAGGGPGRRRRAWRSACARAGSRLGGGAGRRGDRAFAGARRPSPPSWRGGSSRQGGAALLIDYGRDEPGLRRHAAGAAAATGRSTRSPRPGEADLTVHADFPAVLAAARAAGARARPCSTQGEFLRRLGHRGARRGAGARAARPRRRRSRRQLERLIGAGPDGRAVQGRLRSMRPAPRRRRSRTRA